MSNLSIPQMILTLVALFFLLKALLKFAKKERSQTFFKLFANVIIWGGIMLFSLFPKLTHIFSEKLGFGQNLNTLIFIGFVIVFMILFKIINILERTERNISEIIRKEALKEIENSRR
jgi:hypothetical protein